MKIYTRTGDSGETSLYSGQRVSKDCDYMQAVGDVDELNSMVGMALSQLPQGELYESLRTQLLKIQHALFDAGAAIATPRTQASDRKVEQTRFNEEATAALEEWIDAFHQELPPLRNFILPGGHPCGASLHVARCICRRAERKLVAIHADGDVSDRLFSYMNRLSDYLFAAARWINHCLELPETIWQHDL